VGLAPAVLLVYGGVERLSMSYEFGVLMFLLSLVFYFIQASPASCQRP
jgi:hypothetical protein